MLATAAKATDKGSKGTGAALYEDQVFLASQSGKTIELLASQSPAIIL